MLKELTEVLSRSELEASTVRRTVIDAKQFHGLVGKEAADVTSEDVAAYFSLLQDEGMAATTLQRKAASLRKVLVTLAPANALRIEWPTLPKVTRESKSGTLTERQVQDLCAIAEGMSPRDRAIASLLLLTGAKAHAVAELRLSDLKADSVTLTLVAGGRTYEAPLAPRTKAAIDAWLAVRLPVNHDFVFYCERRFPFPPISRAVVWAVWKQLEASSPNELPKGATQAARNAVAAACGSCQELVDRLGYEQRSAEALLSTR
jgi:integrase